MQIDRQTDSQSIVPLSVDSTSNESRSHQGDGQRGCARQVLATRTLSPSPFLATHTHRQHIRLQFLVLTSNAGQEKAGEYTFFLWHRHFIYSTCLVCLLLSLSVRFPLAMEKTQIGRRVCLICSLGPHLSTYPVSLVL